MERRYRSLILGLRNRSARDASVDEAAKSDTPETVRTAAASGARYSLFRSFDSGMELFADTLASQVVRLNAQIFGRDALSPIRLNTRVESLALQRNSNQNGNSAQWIVRTARNQTFVADAICLALPSYASARFLRRIDGELASELTAIPYASSATINLAYERDDITHPLDGFGFVVPFIEKRTVMACTFSSIKFPNRAPAGRVLLRAFVGGALQPELVELSDNELVARVCSDLKSLLGITRAPVFAEVTKWDRSMPQYFVGHVDRVRNIASRVGQLPALALAGNAFNGPGLPDCIRSGEAAADALLDPQAV
jgi:oxygen-dependent protoporphyrinogen oxidase